MAAPTTKKPKPSASTGAGRFSLVLGAGGLVGMAYHAGILAALADAGVDPARAELVVGTSAGSAIGAEVRSGRSIEEIRLRAISEPTGTGDAPTDLFDRSWDGPVEFGQRLVGSAYVVGRSLVRIPGPKVPLSLRRVFPAGMMAADLDADSIEDLVPTEWPADPLWLCAVNIRTGRRVVLGRPGGLEADMRQAVLASCAIPALYQPVRVDGATLVDGGMHSSTNLDLAVEFGSRLIICVAPMAYDRRELPGLATRLIRRPAAQAIEREVLLARAKGAAVMMFRPTVAELALHGVNPMRTVGNEVVADAARRAGRRRLSSERFQRLLRQFELV